MSTTTKAAHTPTQRAVDAIVQMHDARQRKHDCPGYDCSICSLHADESRMAEIIDRETAAPEMLEALRVFANYMEHAGEKSITIKSLAYPLHLAKEAIQKARGGQ
jgi:hypothetical protein